MKRPPGASQMVQRIYGLLVSHPAGMTKSEIHDELREGWLETAAYGAYEQSLRKRRDKPVMKGSITSLSFTRVSDYGTPWFQEFAQRWWIQGRLLSMQQSGTAFREGIRKKARWYAAGKKAPRAMVNCPSEKVHLKQMDASMIQANADQHKSK